MRGGRGYIHLFILASKSIFNHLFIFSFIHPSICPFDLILPTHPFALFCSFFLHPSVCLSVLPSFNHPVIHTFIHPSVFLCPSIISSTISSSFHSSFYPSVHVMFPSIHSHLFVLSSFIHSSAICLSIN